MLYKPHAKVCGMQLNTIEDYAFPNHWHCGLAHMSENELKILAKESLISLSKGEILNPCDYCLFGKHHKVSFHKHLKRKENRLELMHSDLCDPIKVESSHGDRYFVTFIDDASHKTGVYMLKAKSQVFQKSQYFHGMWRGR